MCDTLKITYEELMRQPDWWVDKMMLWHKQRTLAEEHKSKLPPGK
jgi:hypothetical protein